MYDKAKTGKIDSEERNVENAIHIIILQLNTTSVSLRTKSSQLYCYSALRMGIMSIA